MAWSRKSAMFAALAIALYLLGLVLRNSQLVPVAVVLLSCLTWAAFRTTHADVASTGRRMEEPDSDEGIQLHSITAMRKELTVEAPEVVLLVQLVSTSFKMVMN